MDNVTAIAGQVEILGNNALTSLLGFDNLTSIVFGLWIEENLNLTSLTGLDSLTFIGGEVAISNNLSLTSLSGLDNLASIEGYLSISNNIELEDLIGIENIDANTITDLSLVNNSSLSDCDAQSICDYLASPNGTVVISDNAPGCNSQQEVQDDCDFNTFVDESIAEESFTISPNPLESTSLIKYTIQYNSHVTIKILDLTGQEITTHVDELQQQGQQQVIFNTSDLPAGIYFCVLKTNYGMQTKKIIKL